MHTALTFLIVVAGIWLVIWVLAILANLAVMLAAAQQLGNSYSRPKGFRLAEYRTA